MKIAPTEEEQDADTFHDEAVDPLPSELRVTLTVSSTGNEEESDSIVAPTTSNTGLETEPEGHIPGEPKFTIPADVSFSNIKLRSLIYCLDVL